MAEHRQLTDQWDANVYEHRGWQVIELKLLGNSYAEPYGLAESVWAIVADWRPPRMVLDAQHVTFMSSSLMGVLVRLQKRVAMAGGALHVACLPPNPTEALHACQLHNVIALYDTVDTAAGYAT